jgi:general stress protein 26
MRRSKEGNIMERQRHLYELASAFKDAMLVSRALDGTLHARPMALAEMHPNGDLLFSTSLDSLKIKEIQTNPDVLATFQSASQFASIHGTASVVRDRAEIDRLWSESWRIWFPEGKDDPSLCLLRVSADHGEYWDTGGIEGMKFKVESIRARLSGRVAEKSEAQNAKVKL